jgi:diguanylate cyclase (GGDEF)-like protein
MHSTRTTRLPASSAERRDETASQRDDAADKRDELAARRDRKAAIADQSALDLEREGAEGHALRVRALCLRGLEDRDRAAGDREGAERDRRSARADRKCGEHDREESLREREFAATDELTGARRRGVGLEDLQREIDRARRTGDSLVAAYVDVDGLKAVNDEHGHRAGDDVLRDVAEGLRSEMRSYDLLVRLGGDEFLCVLTGVTPDQVRRRFAHLALTLPTGPTLRSVSVGVGELRDGDGSQELVDRADQDLLAGRADRRRGTAAGLEYGRRRRIAPHRAVEPG